MIRFNSAGLRARRRGLLLLAFAITSCGNDFNPASKIESIRIVASRADKPYAEPGDSVVLDLLAIDGRKDQARAMRLFWIPAPCVNPPGGGTYYDCYPAFEGMFTRHADLTARLVSGPRLSLQVPADVLEGAPFGNVFAFSMACAGHVEYVGRRGSSPQAIPFACFDESGAELGPGDFVFAYSRVFVFADRTNANPIILALTVDGQKVDPAAGLVLDHCPTPSGNRDDPTCATVALDVVVPPESQEPDPSNVDANGIVLREGLWVDYYVTSGKVKDDVRVLYDPHVVRVSSADALEAPAAPSDATLWTVVHDNRGGVDWLGVPLHAR